MRADFYLIDKPRFRQQPLLLVCELARRACAARQPTLILTRDFKQAEELDDLLWAFDADAFIPHELAGEDSDPDTAILIAPPGVDTPDRPLLINLRDTVPQRSFERVLEIVPAEDSARQGSRTRWRQYQKAGVALGKHDM